MTKIYVVTGGCYSDYHIVGVFSSEKLANKAAESLNSQVETYELDKHSDRIVQGFSAYRIVMSLNGDVTSVREDTYPCWLDKATEQTCEKKRMPKFSGTKNEYIGWQSVREVYVWARDEKHAVKIAGDRRREMIANGEWETD